jgi:hypothetical protein
MSANELFVGQFVQHWKLKYPIVNNFVFFKAEVVYKWNDGRDDADEFEISFSINLNDSNFGEIDVSNGKKINASNVLTYIDVKYEGTVVEMNSNGTLIISGFSPKCDNYKVSIYPN